MTEEKSEFGKGLVICLVKFTNHFSNDLAKTIRDLVMYQNANETKRKEMLQDEPPSHSNYGKDFHDRIRFYINKIMPIHNNSLEKLISYEIELWVNGATDHLYEIEVPEGKDWNKIRTKVKELQDKGLTMGHSFNDKKTYTIKDMEELQKLTIQIALLIDKKIGLKPDEGEWM